MTPFSSLAVILLLSIFQDAETKNQSKQKIFYSMPSYRFYSPPGSSDDLGTYPCDSAQHGTMICLSVQSCCCFVFKKDWNHSCKLYSFLPEYGSSLEYDSNYQLYYSLEDHKDNWIQVFESVAGTGRNPYELYSSPLSGVWKSSNSLSVFKSSLIENWVSLYVQEVKFVLEQDNQIVVSMIFDGKQSNKTNWFSLNRLIKASPWTDLKTNEPSIFSIVGE
ncbi:uncharacterized protein LOC118763188 [Octopus sinensis]|uniref:Uncharacterized protein LOC118763188 n=1 Tax=Octopus sinensis TaxID=2607531 RepID=A0A7E6EUB3_9MOLL|nr:uncharacterized protein LOC118763188 [Octopus sinensis]